MRFPSQKAAESKTELDVKKVSNQTVRQASGFSRFSQGSDRKRSGVGAEVTVLADPQPRGFSPEVTALADPQGVGGGYHIPLHYNRQKTALKKQ